MLKRKSHARAVGTGSLNKGRCAWDDAIGLRRELEQLGDGGFVATFKLTTAAQIRSEKANAYYFGVVIKAIVDWVDDGTTADDIHDAMCELFLENTSKRVAFFNKMTGEHLEVDVDHRRSSKLTGKPFYEFVEKVRQWAWEFFPGIQIADPDPEYWTHAA